MNRYAVGLAVVIAFSLWANYAYSDELRPALLSIVELEQNEYEVQLTVPSAVSNYPDIRPEWPTNCDGSTVDRYTIPNAIHITKYRVHCPNGLVGQNIRVSGLNGSFREVLVRFQTLESHTSLSRITSTSPGTQLVGRATWQDTVTTYFVFGVTHIATGFDHLLFVLTLILLTTSGRQIAILITAFTFAHSVTLALGIMQIIRLPQVFVEAAIALSILMLIAELARQKNGATSPLSARHQWLIVFIFGLVHGFGFASALSDSGLPEKDLFSALVSFNLGIEFGQLIFVILVVGCISLINPIVSRLPAPIQRTPSSCIGIVAAFWTFERISGFWL